MPGSPVRANVPLGGLFELERLSEFASLRLLAKFHWQGHVGYNNEGDDDEIHTSSTFTLLELESLIGSPSRSLKGIFIGRGTSRPFSKRAGSRVEVKEI